MQPLIDGTSSRNKCNETENILRFLSRALWYTGWSKSLRAPDDYSAIIRCT